MTAVRELAPGEEPLLRELRLAALRDLPEAFGGSLDAEASWSSDAWAERMREASWLVAERDDTCIGLAALSHAPQDRPAEAWLWSWWVAPQARGTGVARAMLKFAERSCAERGWSTLSLGAFTANERAIAAFERLGFTRSGSPLPSTSRPGETYVLMSRTLVGLAGFEPTTP